MYLYFWIYISLLMFKSSAYNLLSSKKRISILKNDVINIEEKSPQESPKLITWTASKFSKTVVKESKRTVEAYMALPSTEYSVLASDNIQRIDDSNFKAILPTMNFFGTKICPILYVDVTVYPDDAKSVIAVKRAETVGSDTALSINGTFSIEAINLVSAGIDEKNRKILTSNTNLKIDVIVPQSSKVPVGVIQVIFSLKIM